MNANNQVKKSPNSLRFTEKMKGFIYQGQQFCTEGYERGKAEQISCQFELTIVMDDLDKFMNQTDHPAQAIGHIDVPIFGGRCPVLKGEFNLFAQSGDINRKTMLYRLFFEDSSGNPLTLTGVKNMRDALGPDMWRDTTTLETTILKGHISASDESVATVVATGILHIQLMDFLHQITTFRSDAPTLQERLMAIEKFGVFFMGQLWKIYGVPRKHDYKNTSRDIALHTLEGVTDANVSTHYATTGDGLGISLLRFNRAPCDDVVVLVPGLTASSDMFIMPEHRNLTSVLLDAGFTDVWTLDGRISNRQPYNLARHNFNVDDVALYDNPAAISKIRQVVGPKARIHIISHCLGALSIAMSLFARTITDIASVIVNGVALTPKVGLPARLKLTAGPFLAENLLSIEYLNPNWREQRGFSFGKYLAKGVSLLHRECDVPACHMTSFMWGFGFPVLFRHENLHDVTHRRTGDLFGGSGANYYRHVHKMVAANNTAVKFNPSDARYQILPDDYFNHAAEITTPMLLTVGEQNALFVDSNVLCYERLQKIVPNRHQLHLFPNYGHADVMIGKDADKDIFPRFITFLRQHSQ